MADMYRVRVLAVEGNRLTCRVTVEYSGERLDPSRTLALWFVTEPWFDLKLGVTSHLPPSCSVRTKKQAQKRASIAPISQELNGRDNCDWDWNWANVGRFISCVGVTDRINADNNPETPEPTEPPQATYTITTTNPGWLQHLISGMEWGTTAFDDDVWPRVMPAWRTSDVLAIARGVDANQTFEGMPILADALQEAGCDSDDILNHLRDPNAAHVRGCWALDLVLGKS